MLRYLGDNAPRYFNNTSGWGVSAPRNRIIINLIEYNDETIADFISRNEVFESNMFLFEQGDLWQGLPPPDPLPLPPGVEHPEPGGPQPPRDDLWTDPNEPTNVARWITESFPTNEMGVTIYPDYFGGMYFDIYNNGRLVLLRVSSATEPMPTFSNFPDVYVRDVEFSYNELLAMMNFTIAIQSANLHYFHNVSGWGLDTRANRISVGLIEYNDETIADFRSINEGF